MERKEEDEKVVEARSKREALRFRPVAYQVQLRTAYEDLDVFLQNISTHGCALTHVSYPLVLQEKILLVVPLQDESVEIGARVVRLEGETVGVKFIQVSESARQRLFSFFARLQRQKL